MTSVPQRLVRLIRLRDAFRCAAEGPTCTRFTDLTTHHRINRGMGGSKLLDRPEVLLTLCDSCNNLLESNADFAELGRERGWKLYSWQQPLNVAVWYSWAAEWHHLDADGEWVEPILTLKETKW